MVEVFKLGRKDLAAPLEWDGMIMKMRGELQKELQRSRKKSFKICTWSRIKSPHAC
jgi:hypothetical protein